MPEMNFLARLTQTPKGRTSIFRLTTPRVDNRMLLAAAKSFRLSGDERKGTMQQDATTISYSEGPHALTLHRASGALRYRDNSRWQVDDGRSNVEFSDDEAVEMAQKAVRQNKLAPAKELKVLKVSRLHVGTLNVENKRGEERVIDVGVAFQRMVGGVPVDGPGGKLVVFIDHAGQVTGVDRIWRGIQGVYRPIKELRPPEFAEEEMEHYWRNQKSGRIDVREVRFGYFEMGWQDAQRYLQPAYIMLVTLVSPNERFTMNSVFVSPAAVKPVGTLMPEPVPTRRQRPRSD